MCLCVYLDVFWCVYLDFLCVYLDVFMCIVIPTFRPDWHVVIRVRVIRVSLRICTFLVLGYLSNYFMFKEI